MLLYSSAHPSQVGSRSAVLQSFRSLLSEIFRTAPMSRLLLYSVLSDGPAAKLCPDSEAAHRHAPQLGSGVWVLKVLRGIGLPWSEEAQVRNLNLLILSSAAAAQ